MNVIYICPNTFSPSCGSCCNGQCCNKIVFMCLVYDDSFLIARENARGIGARLFPYCEHSTVRFRVSAFASSAASSVGTDVSMYPARETSGFGALTRNRIWIRRLEISCTILCAMSANWCVVMDLNHRAVKTWFTVRHIRPLCQPHVINLADTLGVEPRRVLPPQFSKLIVLPFTHVSEFGGQ